MNEVYNVLIAAASFQLQTPTFTTLLILAVFIVTQDHKPFMKKYGVILVPLWCVGISLQGWNYFVFCTMFYFWIDDKQDRMTAKVVKSKFVSTHGKLFDRYGIHRRK